MKRFLIILFVISLIIAGFLSWFASPKPDGLESVAEEHGFIEKTEESSYEIFPDYTFRGINTLWSNGLAGIIGVIASFLLVTILGKLIYRRKRNGGQSASSPH